MVRGRRYAQHFRPFPLEARPGLNTEIQLKLPINTVDPLVVPAEPFNVPEVGETQAKAPAFVCRCQRQQPMGDLPILTGRLWGVAIAGLADPHAFAD